MPFLSSFLLTLLFFEPVPLSSFVISSVPFSMPHLLILNHSSESLYLCLLLPSLSSWQNLQHPGGTKWLPGAAGPSWTTDLGLARCLCSKQWQNSWDPAAEKQFRDPVQQSHQLHGSRIYNTGALSRHTWVKHLHMHAPTRDAPVFLMP